MANNAPDELKAKWLKQHQELHDRLHRIDVLLWSIQVQNGHDPRYGTKRENDPWEPRTLAEERWEARFSARKMRAESRRQVQIRIWTGEWVKASEAYLGIRQSKECSFCGGHTSRKWTVTWPGSKTVICAQCRQHLIKDVE